MQQTIIIIIRHVAKKKKLIFHHRVAKWYAMAIFFVRNLCEIIEVFKGINLMELCHNFEVGSFG